MGIRISTFNRIFFLIALVSLWAGGATTIWLQAFYQLAAEPIRICAKEKLARTLLDSAKYTLILCEDNEVNSINTSRSEYSVLHEGDTVCYSYNSIFGQKFNFQQRSCWQTDAYSPILKLRDLFENL